jgi:hypothetical protein
LVQGRVVVGCGADCGGVEVVEGGGEGGGECLIPVRVRGLDRMQDGVGGGRLFSAFFLVGFGREMCGARPSRNRRCSLLAALLGWS